MKVADSWKRCARRIDALGLRERCMLFVSAATLVVAAGDGALLSPAIAGQKQLAERLKRERTELSALRVQLDAASHDSGDSPVARLRREFAQWQARQQAVDADIARLGTASGDQPTLAQLLERTLARHERLTLLKIATVADAPAAASAAGAGNPPNSAPNGAPNSAPSSAPSLRWQGVDLGVSGSYADLTDYLAELERALPGLRWDTLKLNGSATAPSSLVLRLYLVEAAP
jgi:MSHA biogenesis protein MshJ